MYDLMKSANTTLPLPRSDASTAPPLGAVMAVAALVKLVYDITKDNLSETAVLGILGALIVWAVGLLADQNSRIATRRK
jgi:hypothetical protein